MSPPQSPGNDKEHSPPQSPGNDKEHSPPEPDSEIVTVGSRVLSPAHFLFKIESFSLLSKYGIDEYESSEFESGDYKWKLIIYPNGRNTKDGTKHVSAFLAVADTRSPPTGWEFNAVFSIFLFNHKLDNFMFMKDQKRFHLINPEWGFSNFIAKETFTDPSNGYIVDDKCVFGAEVFVIKSKGIGECLSPLKYTDSYKHEIKIPKFSKLKNTCYSEEFITGDHKWKLQMNQKGKFVSIFLYAFGMERQSFYRKLNVNFTICMKNQFDGADCKEFKSPTVNNWFSASYPCWGWQKFIPIADMNDPKKGFVVGDICIIEVEISIKAIIRSLP